jgi:hypothetical protein
MGVAGWNSPQVRTLNYVSSFLQRLTMHTSAEPATASPTTERPSTSSLSTTLLRASTLPRQPWTSLPTARLRLSVVSMLSTPRLLLATAACKHCVLTKTMMS